MTVAVYGLQELVERLAKGPLAEDCCVSIANPLDDELLVMEDLDSVRHSFSRVLPLHFNDVDMEIDFGTNRHYPPSRRDAEAIVRFYRETCATARGYVLHCRAGVSRSGAAALGLLYLILGDEERAVAELVRIRPQAAPLRVLVEHFDAILGSRLLPHVAELHRRAEEAFARKLMASFERMES
jgi:predicted protein tyrosine phosphatase